MQSAIQNASQLLSLGKAQEAEHELRNNLTNNPQHEETLALLGHSLMMQERLDEAVKIFEVITSYHPKSANAFVELASVLKAQNKNSEAELAFQRAVELNPSFSEAWHFLGNLLMQRNAREEAKSCFVNAERTDPLKQHFVEVQKAFAQKQYHQVEQMCRQALQRNPNHTQALHTLARLAEQVEAYEEAIKILSRGLNYAPFHISLWQSLIKNFNLLGLFEDAIDGAKKLLSIEPDNIRFTMLLGETLANTGHYEESVGTYDKAIKLRPKDANIHLLRGHVLKTLGRREECESAYRKSIELEKVNGTAYWSLADLKSYKFSDADRKRMQALLNDSSVPPAQASQAGFALAKSMEDEGDFELAFEFYDKANALRPDTHFVAEEYQQQCDAIKGGFKAATMTTHAELEADAATPIFIVGLTRSGSTLIEQILASHSQIEGTMELFSLPRVVRHAGLMSKKKGSRYPQAISKFSADELTILGNSYLEETAIFRTNKPYFIDKLPPNFHNVGLIHQILPHAIIIDARRHPLSTGFSNFKQHFAGGYDFSYSLKTIGEYYNGYLDLMDYWDTELPNKVLCVQYEEMVKDTENQVRRILNHCGVPYEEQCLSFYQNKRAVRTASSEQVRQPINTKGLEQWLKFEQYLGPLKQSLGEETLNRFSRWL